MDGNETVAQCQVVCLTNGLEKLPKEASNVKEEGDPRPETGVRSNEGGLMSEPESRWICGELVVVGQGFLLPLLPATNLQSPEHHCDCAVQHVNDSQEEY